MNVLTQVLLLLRSFAELIRYEVLLGIGGYAAVHRGLGRRKDRRVPAGAAEEVCRAFNRVLMFYPRNVMCLQSSIALARVLRCAGLDAHVVVGYRPNPFFSHAWIEVDGAVVNDLKGYASQLLVLDRI